MKNEDKKDLGFKSIIFMLSFTKGKTFTFWFGLLLVSSLSFLNNVFTGQLYRSVTTINQSTHVFFTQLLWVFLLLVFIVILTILGHWIFTKATAFSEKNLRKSLAYKMSRMPMKQWYKHHSGEWLTVLGKDAQKAITGHKNYMLIIFSTLIDIIGGIVVVLLSSPPMFIFAICSGVLYSGIGLFSRKRFKKHEKASQQSIAVGTAHLTDILNGFIVIRVYNLLDDIMNKHKKAVSDTYEAGVKIAKVGVLNGALSQIGYTIAYSGTLIMGLILVNMGSLELSEMMLLWPISMGLSNAISTIGFIVTQMQTTVVAIDRIRLATELEEESGGYIENAVQTENAIELKNLSFSYDDKRPVLKNVSLSIKSGEKVAFVGESGSGKSTLVKLLLRFYKAKEGSLLLYSKPVQDYTLNALRGQFSYVAQSAYLLSGSVYDNIAMVNKNTDKNSVISAAKNAYADIFIKDLAEGYNTEVGERGANLSGEQRQRIAIARAFLKNSPIIIFDEITASLDGESEAEVLKAVESTPKEKTLLMITHRLSTAVNADKIVVMKEGEIVEVGSHETLLKQKGVYKNLWETQFKQAEKS